MYIGLFIGLFIFNVMTTSFIFLQKKLETAIWKMVSIIDMILIRCFLSSFELKIIFTSWLKAILYYFLFF